ncbi:cathecol O-methyltransferase 1 [Beta vulgaris subsp. vulgaris]|uniref:cathecol O-methyltransferase 1 n=1 Tax=Beta vulgaris subsp. vulgaris TaxID=3555 RepID=UPI0025488E4A|nr:cathecol O-methyltransferase 1 [Beta vulgaris subsp. vulgaris]
MANSSSCEIKVDGDTTPNLSSPKMKVHEIATTSIVDKNTKFEVEVEDDDANFVAATLIMQSGTLSMAMKAAVELNIFDIMAKAGLDRLLSPKEIVAELPASQNPDAASMLDRVLRLLACHSVVSCSFEHTAAVGGGVERRYGLSPISKFFVGDENGVSLGPFLSLTEDPIVRASWGKFNEAILEGGISFNKVYGVHAFDYPRSDPRFNEVFNSAMFNYTTIIIKKILQKYKGFGDIKQLVDVGGGLGHSLHAITSMYPFIKGVNFDLPHVICNAKSYPGIEHIGGDMFQSVPQGDAIFMRWILHDWSDDHCLSVLKNCHKAIPENGKVIVVDSIVIEQHETTAIAKTISLMDVYMMNKNPGGKERTQKEFIALANAAGFTKIRIVCRVCQVWIMEFHK